MKSLTTIFLFLAVLTLTTAQTLNVSYEGYEETTLVEYSETDTIVKYTLKRSNTVSFQASHRLYLGGGWFAIEGGVKYRTDNTLQVATMFQVSALGVKKHQDKWTVLLLPEIGLMYDSQLATVDVPAGATMFVQRKNVSIQLFAEVPILEALSFEPTWTVGIGVGYDFGYIPKKLR